MAVAELPDQIDHPVLHAVGGSRRIAALAAKPLRIGRGSSKKNCAGGRVRCPTHECPGQYQNGMTSPSAFRLEPRRPGAEKTAPSCGSGPGPSRKKTSGFWTGRAPALGCGGHSEIPLVGPAWMGGPIDLCELRRVPYNRSAMQQSELVKVA